MKRIIACLFCLSSLLVSGCSVGNERRSAECPRCFSYEEIAGMCPSCNAELCSWCLPDVEDALDYYLESSEEIGYENGYEEGYDDGYCRGFYYAAEIIFSRMTPEEHKRWSAENSDIDDFYDDGKEGW